MSGLYNFTQSLDPSFNIVNPGPNRPTANVGSGYPGGSTNMSTAPMNPGSANKAFMQATNGQVKITVSTRTTDQKKINSAQLCFIDNTNFDRPTLHGLQEVNRRIVERSTPSRLPSGKFASDMGPMDDKKTILDTFKLLGVVSNNDVDNDAISYNNTMAFQRGPRTFTIVTWGDAFLLDYWSHRGNTLRRYDECYLVLKRVKIDKSHSYQTDLTCNNHDIPTPFNVDIDYSRKYWQWVPFTCKRGSIPLDQILKKEKKYDPKTKTLVEEDVEIGSYLRIGHVHEYADIGHHVRYKKRDEYSVSRDVTYLHRNGKVRPFQFYLHLDDECRLV